MEALGRVRGGRRRAVHTAVGGMDAAQGQPCHSRQLDPVRHGRHHRRSGRTVLDRHPHRRQPRHRAGAARQRVRNARLPRPGQLPDRRSGQAMGRLRGWPQLHLHTAIRAAVLQRPCARLLRRGLVPPAGRAAAVRRLRGARPSRRGRQSGQGHRHHHAVLPRPDAAPDPGRARRHRLR